MPTVTETLVAPDGTADAGRSVQFSLVDASGTPLRQGWLAATNKTIVGQASKVTDVDGKWTVALPGNADITPAGTRWLRRVMMTGANVEDLFVVPASGGPYDLDDLVVAPAAGLVQPAPFGQLAYVKLGGAPNTTVDTTSTSMVKVPGLETTFVARARPVLLRASISKTYTSGVEVGIRYQLYVDGTTAGPGTMIVGVAEQRASIDTVQTFPAGPHTLDLRWQLTAAGTGKLVPTSFLGIPCEAYLEVVER